MESSLDMNDWIEVISNYEEPSKNARELLGSLEKVVRSLLKLEKKKEREKKKLTSPKKRILIGMSDGPYKKVSMSVRRKEDHECTREEYNDKWMVLGISWELNYPPQKEKKNWDTPYKEGR